MRKPVFGVFDQYDSNWSAQLHRLASVIKLHIKKLEILFYLGSEQKRY